MAAIFIFILASHKVLEFLIKILCKDWQGLKKLIPTYLDEFPQKPETIRSVD